MSMRRSVAAQPKSWRGRSPHRDRILTSRLHSVGPRRSRTMQLLGLEFADLDATAAAGLLASRPAAAPFGYVATPNADHLVRLHRHPALRPLYQGAMLLLLDSRVVAL